MGFITDLVDEKPAVLVVSESQLRLNKLLLSFFASNQIEVRFLAIDDNFLTTSSEELLAGMGADFYKVVVVYGFSGFDQSVAEKISQLLQRVSINSQTSLTLLSTRSTQFSSLSDQSQLPELVYQKNLFVQNFKSRFPAASVFIARDLLSDNQFLDYPLLALFSEFNQSKSILDPELNFYLQDESGFFDAIRDYLIKPDTGRLVEVRGKKTKSDVVVKKIIYLYEQYFYHKLSCRKIIVEEIEPSLSQEFVVVKNRKLLDDFLLDSLVREIHKRLEGDSPPAKLISVSPSDVRKISERNKPKSSAVQIPVKPTRTSFSGSLLNFIKKTATTPLKEPEAHDSAGNIIQKVESLFSSSRAALKTTRQQQNIQQNQLVVQQVKKRRVLFWFGLVVAVIGASCLLLLVVFTENQRILNKQLYSVVKQGKKNIKEVDESIYYSAFIWQYQWYQRFFSAESLTVAADIKRLRDVLLNLTDKTEKYEQSLFDFYQKSLQTGVEMSWVYESLLSSMDEKNAAEKEYYSFLTDINLDLYEGEEKQVWSSELEMTRKSLLEQVQSQRFLSALQELLLADGRANVLVLLQDSEQLRSLGGVIDGAFFFSMERGVLVDHQSFSVAEIEGSIYGNRENPEEIKRFTGENSYRFANLSWQSDLLEASRDAAWFIGQSVGQRVDLVMLINTKTLENLAVVLDYSQMTGQSGLLNKLLRLNSSELMRVTSVLGEALNQKELLLSSTDQNLQQAIELNSWGGRQLDVSCPVEFQRDDCLADSIFQQENNLSRNSTESFVERTIEHNIGVTENFVRHRRLINWKGRTSDGVKMGEYRFLLKFYLPLATTLEKLELNGRQLSEGEFFWLDVGQKRELSLAISLDEGDARELLLSYLVPNLGKNNFSYAFLDQKQAGVRHKETHYQLVFADQLFPRVIAPATTYQNKTIKFFNNNQDNFFFAVNFIEQL